MRYQICGVPDGSEKSREAKSDTVREGFDSKEIPAVRII
jgi:hypothetical protein